MVLYAHANCIYENGAQNSPLKERAIDKSPQQLVTLVQEHAALGLLEFSRAAEAARVAAYLRVSLNGSAASAGQRSRLLSPLALESHRCVHVVDIDVTATHQIGSLVVVVVGVSLLTTRFLVVSVVLAKFVEQGDRVLRRVAVEVVVVRVLEIRLSEALHAHRRVEYGRVV